jgi:hypothetical protein
MSTPVITIFVRHSKLDGKPCKYSGDEFSNVVSAGGWQVVQPGPE